MSRLQTRIHELERRLGNCPACKTTVELAYIGRPRREAPPVDCPVCGQPQEQIIVHLAFDPGAGG